MQPPAPPGGRAACRCDLEREQSPRWRTARRHPYRRDRINSMLHECYRSKSNRRQPQRTGSPLPTPNALRDESEVIMSPKTGDATKLASATEWLSGDSFVSDVTNLCDDNDLTDDDAILSPEIRLATACAAGVKIPVR
jgi:hypothetical protein